MIRITVSEVLRSIRATTQANARGKCVILAVVCQLTYTATVAYAALLDPVGAIRRQHNVAPLLIPSSETSMRYSHHPFSMPTSCQRPQWIRLREPDYTLPQAKLRDHRMHHRTVWLRRRYSKLFIAALVVAGSYVLVKLLSQDSRKMGPFIGKLLDILLPESGPKPPLYEQYREAEIDLSQKVNKRPETKYIFFADHMRRKYNIIAVHLSSIHVAIHEIQRPSHVRVNSLTA